MFRSLLLTLTLLASIAPASRAADPAPTDHKLRVVLVGYSTVAEKSGWGTAFIKRLAPDTEGINAARGGQSSKSFLDQGYWKRVLDQKPNWVLIQFGHNDEPGKGPNRETDPETTYRANLIRFVDEARAAGVKPVLVTSMVRRVFQPDKQHLRVDLEPYVAAMKRVAEEKQVPLVDLHERSRELVEESSGPIGVIEMEPDGSRPGTPRRHASQRTRRRNDRPAGHRRVAQSRARTRRPPE